MPQTESGLATTGRATEACGIQRLRVGDSSPPSPVRLRLPPLGWVRCGGTLTWLFERGRADANLRSLPDSLGGQ
jgi:hypothetical protein